MMGAWGAGPFDNDDAADFVAEFEEAPTVSKIASPLERIANAAPDDYVEAPECSEAVAAAALIALTARANDLVSETSLDILRVLQVPEKAQLARTAIAAITRIGSDSELKELWDDADEASREA